MSTKTHGFADLLEGRYKKMLFDAHFRLVPGMEDYIPQKIRRWTKLRWWIGDRLYSVAVRFNPYLSDNDYD